MSKKVYLVTGNKMKVKVANHAVKGLGLVIEQLDVETPEIQSMDVKKIAAYSAKWAADNLHKPVLKMDNSLWIDALNGFPGPFVAHVDNTLGEDGILKLMSGHSNRAARFIMAVAFCEPGGTPIVEIAELRGTISEKLQGKHGWFSDFFFIPEGLDKTMGSYPDDIRKSMWPLDYWSRIARRILQKND